jgi:trans-aconitate methyltransferase
VDTERRLSFGSVAELYDSSRPSYPAELVDDAIAYAPVADDGPVRIVEVGAGTGKATVLFAARGASILAIEPDPEMAEIGRRNTEAFPAVSVLRTEFEKWEVGERRFGLLISAQAWHWIEPEVRLAKAREALVDDGALAVFWNRPQWDRCELTDALRDAYEATEPAFDAMPGPMRPGEVQSTGSWGAYGEDLDAEHGFAVEPVRFYAWTHTYTTDEYVRLLQTHSDHILLPDASREALLDAVRAAIDGAGGTFELPHRTHLWLARRM